MSRIFKPALDDATHRCSRLALTGLVLLITGAACLGWVRYQYVETNAASQHAFRVEKTQLRHGWQQDQPQTPAKDAAKADPKPRSKPRSKPRHTTAGSVIPSPAFALLRIPAFGDDYEVPILSGTGPGALSRGVGHYSSTAMPGEVGNFAIAGHRVTHGQPFARLLELNRGDKIVVETRTAIYSYTLDVAPRDLTVKSKDIWVLNPVPGKNTRPTKALLTLTTCQDLFRSPDRSIGFGHLTRTTTKRRS